VFNTIVTYIVQQRVSDLGKGMWVSKSGRVTFSWLFAY